MTTITGVDLRPGHHAAAAHNTQGEVQRVEEFPNSPEGLEAFLAWLEGLGSFKLAVEGPTQVFFAPWLTGLSAEGIPVVAIPTQQVRERRGRRKTDPHDAVLVARVLQAEPTRLALNPPRGFGPCRNSRALAGSWPSSFKQDRMHLRTVQTPAVEASLQRIVGALMAEIQALEGQIDQEVRAVAPELMDLQGVGTVIAGVLLAEVGGIQRFRTIDGGGVGDAHQSAIRPKHVARALESGDNIPPESGRGRILYEPCSEGCHVIDVPAGPCCCGGAHGSTNRALPIPALRKSG